MHAPPCLPEMEWNKQLNLVFLIISNCAWKPSFIKSSHILSRGGFNLHKFISNSATTLRQRNNVQMSQAMLNPRLLKRTRVTLRTFSVEDDEEKILGVKWNFVQNTLVFDLNELANVIRSLKATKRQIVGITTRLRDPLGFMSPKITQIKMFFQELCV